MLFHGELAVVVADGRAGAAATAVAKQSYISSRFQILDSGASGKKSKFDEVIAAAARAELCPGAVTVGFGNGTYRPISFQYRIVAAVSKTGADAKTSFSFDSTNKPVLDVLK